MAKKIVASDLSEEAVKPAASVEAKLVPEPKEEAPKLPEESKAPTELHVPVGSKAEAMRLFLASQPKVRVLIPLAAGEKPGVTQSVILNGYATFIRKGDYVEVAKPIADVLEEKMKHKMTVENHPNRLSSDGEVQMTAYGS
jgi:hypothetical protein